MNYLTDTRELIIALKKVKKERKLNIDQITKIVQEANPNTAPSRACIANVFKDGSEDNASHYRFDITLKPICNALLDIDSITPDDSAEDVALKSLARYKMDLLDRYAAELDKAKEELKVIKEKEREKYNKKVDELTNNFNKSMEFAKEQIALKDHRIDQLLNANDRLSVTNTKLIEQLMDCPLRKECKEDAP